MILQTPQCNALFNNMTQGAFFLNAAGHPEDVNQAALDMLGVERSEFLARGLLSQAWRIVREDGSPLPSEEFPSLFALKTGKPLNNVTIGIHNPRLGNFVWMAINAIPLPAEGQTCPQRVLVTLHDVTDRKRLDDIHAIHRHLLQYAENHTFSKLLVETLDRAEVLTGSEISFFMFFDEDQQVVTLLECSTRTAMGPCSSIKFNKPYAIGSSGVWIECLHQRRPVIYNDFSSLSNRRRLPAGHPLVTRMLLVPLERNGRIVAVIGLGNKPHDYTQKEVDTAALLADIAWDVAQIKMVEEESGRVSRAWQTTFDSIKDVIFLLDPDMRIKKANLAATTFMNLSCEQLVGRHCWEVVHGSKEPIPECPVVRAMQSRKREVFELQLNDCWTEITADPVLDNEGLCTGTVHILEDISLRKQVEQNLVERSAEMGRFINTVSHDLRSPLVTIKGFLGIVQESLKKADKDLIDPGKLLDDLEYVDNAAIRVGLLLDDLLRLARLGRLADEVSIVAYDDLVEETLMLLAGPLQGKQIEIIHQKDPLLLRGDRNRMVDIWQNLIENAIKYMGDQPKLCIEIGLQRKMDSIIFFVRDNGMGIEPRFHRKIFNLFDKLDQESEGTGLGLALVQRIVAGFQGKIWVESEGRGTGSCFFFTLPAAITPSEETAQA